jgi:hypothetical protein
MVAAVVTQIDRQLGQGFGLDQVNDLTVAGGRTERSGSALPAGGAERRA